MLAASVSLQKRASTGFVSSRGNYLYAAHLTNPSGRYTVSFTTDSSLTTKLRYVIAIKKLSAADGHLALSINHPIRYAFKTAGTARHVSLGTWTGTTQTVYSRASGYAPAADGRLVQDLKVHATIDTGAQLTSAAVVGMPSTSIAAEHTDVTGSLATAEVALPPAVFPKRVSSSGVSATLGDLHIRWTVQLYDTVGTTRGVDLTAAPGPFLLLNPGSTTDEYTEAEVLSSGSTITVAFDSDDKSTDDSRAKLSHKLIRVSLPSRWWSSRFTLKGTPTDGPDSGAVVELSRYMSEVHYSPEEQHKLASGSSNINSNFDADPGVPGVHVMPNTAMSTVSANQPMAGVGSPETLGSYPFFDSRFQRSSAYILVCRSTSCDTASSATVPTKVTATIKLESVAGFGGECSSNADCVQGDNGHPAQDRASALSSNGDVARFDQCITFVGSSGRTPETRCVECTADCDCNPGQFCYTYTGIQRIGPHQTVVHEESRLRAGTCRRRDMNNTQLGQKCRRNDQLQSPGLYQPAGDQDVTFSSFNVPHVLGQPGPVPCGEFVVTNGSYVTSTQAYTDTSGMAIVALWTGTCNGDGICAECRASVGNSLNLQCSSQQICLDGRWWRAYSMDYTIRTLTNNATAGGVLAVALAAFFIAFIAGWTCICATCCSGEGGGRCCKRGGKDSKSTAPKSTRRVVDAEPVAVKP